MSTRRGVNLIQTFVTQCKKEINLHGYWTKPKMETHIQPADKSHFGTNGNTSNLKVVQDECLGFKFVVQHAALWQFQWKYWKESRSRRSSHVF